jgi:hypothetical protein
MRKLRPSLNQSDKEENTKNPALLHFDLKVGRCPGIGTRSGSLQGHQIGKKSLFDP